MLPAGNTFIKMPSITGGVLWPPASDHATAQRGNTHPQSLCHDAFGHRHFLQEQWEPLSDCCQSSPSQRGTDNLCTASCPPPGTQQLWWSCAPSASQQLSPTKPPFMGAWLLCLQQRGSGTLSTITWPQQTPANPFWMLEEGVGALCSFASLDVLKSSGGTHCEHSPWHLDRQRRSPAWEQGNCKDCIMYNLPLWVQGWLSTGCSLPQEQHFLGSGLALVAVLWKPEKKQMSHVLGDLLCRRCLCFLPAHLSQKSCHSSGRLHGGAFPSGKETPLSLLCLSS